MSECDLCVGFLDVIMEVVVDFVFMFVNGIVSFFDFWNWYN